jgi:class 3 adenylate cyclase
MMAQDKVLDSMKYVLSKALPDTNKVNTLNALSRRTINSSPEEAFAYGARALQLADSLNFTRGKAYALKWVGLYYFTVGKNVEALETWQKSLADFRAINDKQGIANMLSNIGALYDKSADDANALDNYLQALPIAESINDKLRIATVLQNIGNTYMRKNATWPQALQYLKQALPISEEIGNRDAVTTIISNLGDLYNRKGFPDSALLYLKRGLKTSIDVEEITTNYLLNRTAESYAEKGEFATAIDYHNQAIALATKLKANDDIGKSLLALAKTYQKQKNWDLALTTFGRAEKILKEGRIVEELRDAYQGMFLAYAAKGDFIHAFENLKLYSDYKDSIYNSEQDKKLANLQISADMKSLSQKKALSDLELQRQKVTRNAFAVGFLLILIIVFVLYRNYRQKVKTNLILDKQKAQIETLMLNILPQEVATELQETGHATPRNYDSVSILFTDFKSFTALADKMEPRELINELNESFMAFDEIIERNQIEKIKTIGDAYMCAGGIPTPNEGYVLNIIKTGLEIQEYMQAKNDKRTALGLPKWELRVGIHVGPIVAGVVGRKKYAYDIWGNSVNIASRMESNGEPGRVNISATTYEIIKDVYNCSYRGKISAKNIGEIDMYFVDGLK